MCGKKKTVKIPNRMVMAYKAPETISMYNLVPSIHSIQADYPPKKKVRKPISIDIRARGDSSRKRVDSKIFAYPFDNEDPWPT